MLCWEAVPAPWIEGRDVLWCITGEEASRNSWRVRPRADWNAMDSVSTCKICTGEIALHEISGGIAGCLKIFDF